jgi:hypothetical protein
MFEDGEAEGQILALPSFTNGFVGLFALSNLIYLGSKLGVHTKSQKIYPLKVEPSGKNHVKLERSADREYEGVIALYRIYRSYIEHEDRLIHNRTTWLITIQSFLIATFGFSFQKWYELSMNPATQWTPTTINATKYYQIFLISLCIVGFIVSIIAFFALKAAAIAIRNLHDEWKKLADTLPFDHRLPVIIGGGIDQSVSHGLFLPLPLPFFFVSLWLISALVLTFPVIWTT